MIHQVIREAIALSELRQAGRITTGQMLDRVQQAATTAGATVNVRTPHKGGPRQPVELIFSTGDVLVCDGRTTRHLPPPRAAAGPP